MVRLLVLASFNMDLVMRAEQPRPGETLQGTFAMYPGGKGYNQAVAARRLGAEVIVAGRVGSDEFGEVFLAALDREGIDRRGVRRDEHEGTGVASITVLPSGENAIVQAPRANLRFAYDDLPGIDATTSSHHGRSASVFDGIDCVMATLETPAAVSARVQSEVRAIPAPPRFVFNVAPASRLLRLPEAAWDIVVANAIEAEAFTGIRIDDPATAAEAAALAVRRDRINLMAITLGAQGAVAASEGRRVAREAFQTAVVDTTGAGDAFCAALAVSVAEGAELEDAMRFASAAGALACRRHGAEPSMPYREEVDALLAAQRAR